MTERETPLEQPDEAASAAQAEIEPTGAAQKRKTVVYTGFGGFLLFILAVSVFFYFNFTTIEVQGNSMEPTLDEGQRLLVSKAYWLVGDIKDNDIVVIKNPVEDEVIIKRVYKSAGEAVDLAMVPDSWDVTQGNYIVPEGTIYVIGDNVEVSQDSRHYGPFELKDVLGKVVVIQSAFDSSDES
jgi:signal peptidase I